MAAKGKTEVKKRVKKKKKDTLYCCTEMFEICLADYRQRGG